MPAAPTDRPRTAAARGVLAAAACVLLAGAFLLGAQSCTQDAGSRAPGDPLGKRPLEVVPQRPAPPPPDPPPLPPT